MLVAISYALYASEFDPAARWDASNNDPADYRFVAEFFWGVPHRPETYVQYWNQEWGAYLRTVPFRGIGLGTLYLIAGWVRIGHVPATDAEILKAGLGLNAAEKLLLAAALLAVFASMLRRLGAPIALAALAILAFPPHFWRLCDDFLAEPWTRILFLFALACAIALTAPRAAKGWWLGILGMFFVAAQLKVQWYVAAWLILPLAVWDLYRSRSPRWVIAAACAIAVATPLGVVAVNWIGWRTTTLAPAFGIHANLRYDGDVLRRFSEAEAGDPARPPFADPMRPQIRWWNIYIGPETTREQYETFDRFARAYVSRHAGPAARNFWHGLQLAATVPGVTHHTGWRIRLEPLDEPWSTLMRGVDVLVWALLLIGVGLDDTRAACGLALVLWIVPALGNVVSPYELRYHMPMAGIGAVSAAIVVAHVVRRWRPRRLHVRRTAVQ